MKIALGTANFNNKYGILKNNISQAQSLKNIFKIIKKQQINYLDTAFDYSSIIAGPSYYNKPNGLITLGVYCTNYTGDFYMQGTTASSPSDGDWFDLDLTPFYDYHEFNAFTGIEPFSIQSNLSYLRAKVDNTLSGTVDKIVIRV